MEPAARETWSRRVERWKASGLSAKEFAAKTGINARSLSWWRWRLNAAKAQKGTCSSERAMQIASSPLPPLSFIEMTTAVTRDPLEIVFPSALRIRVPVGFDDATLARVVDLLERRR